MIEDFVRNFRKITEQFQKENLVFHELYSNGGVSLAQWGWYFGGEMPVLKILDSVKKVKYGNQSEVDKFFIEYYSNNLVELAAQIGSKYSERKLIIDEAVKCHDLEMFHASTSLFIAQADGICNGNLFKTKNSKNAIAKFIKSNSNSNKTPFYLSPILEESAIDVYHPNKSKFKSNLNRHGVMHGYDTDYGTKTNSLKAFSLLCYITDFIDRFQKNK